MSIEFVNINGRQLTEQELALTAKAQRKARVASEKPESFHKGFRVEGHQPGALERAREADSKAYAEWVALTDDERKKRRQDGGGRDPKPWNEATWRSSTKLKAVRSKPYEVKEAADQCAELARKAGWLDVVVRAVAKSAEQGATA